MVSDELSNDPSDSVPTGNNTNYRGGDMANNGVANQGPVRNAQVGGSPGGTGSGPPPPPPGPDLSARARIECEDGALEGFFPDQARDEGITGMRVSLSVTVDADGSIVSARATNDPGYGFARSAERAMRSGACTATPAKNREGQNIRSTVSFTINFELSS
jgi:TonB family protein